MPNVPRTKNWLPSLVKNLEPLTEMVGIALTVARPARAQVKIAGNMAGRRAIGEDKTPTKA
jgi:hypothetical protein